jgi:hypothetical protein
MLFLILLHPLAVESGPAGPLAEGPVAGGAPSQSLRTALPLLETHYGES